MISTVLVAHPWLAQAAFVALVVVGVPAGAWLVRRPAPTRVATGLALVPGRPAPTRVATGLALVPVGVLTLVPSATEPYPGCAVAWQLPTAGRVELLANVVLFVAPVLLAGVLWRRPVAALLVGSAASAVIEAVQALVPALGRSCDTNDWLSNTIGAALGAVLAFLALGLAGRLARRRGEVDATTARSGHQAAAC